MVRYADDFLLCRSQQEAQGGFGKCSVTEEIEAVLSKIEYWHQGSISSFKIMCRDGKGFWHGVRWDGKTAAYFDLQETDERQARKKLLDQTSGPA